MNAAPPRLRVALSATPPLLADSLRALLADEHTDVTLIVDPGCDHYDVAIVTPGAASVPADVVIELDATPRTQGGGVVRRGREVIELPDIQAVVHTVRHLRPGTGTVG